MEPTWEDFCLKRLGMTRSYVHRTIRQYKEIGPEFSRLNSFTQIPVATEPMIASAAMTFSSVSVISNALRLRRATL